MVLKRQMFSLILDTTQSTESKVMLVGGDKILQETAAGSASAQKVLISLENLLKDNGIDPAQVNTISISTGPGSYTGLRVGVAIAQMLGLLLNIPVNDIKPGDRLKIDYGGTGNKFGISD